MASRIHFYAQAFLATILFVFALLPAGAMSRETTKLNSDTNFFQMSLEELLSIPITGSTNSEQNLNSAPSAVTVFTHNQFSRLGVNTLAELANFAPGFQVLRSADTGRYTMASSRGRRISATSAEILILVDGYRIEANNFSAIAGLFELPLSNIARVEFIRGPGAALYGSNAMMGVINVVTLEGDNSLKMQTGSYSTNNVYLNKSFSKKDFAKLDFQGAYTHSSGQDYILPDTYSGEAVNSQDPFTRLHLLLKADVSDFRFSAAYYKVTTEDFYLVEANDPDYNRQTQDYRRISVAHKFDYDSFQSETFLSYTSTQNLQTFRLSSENVFLSISSPQSASPLIADINIQMDKINVFNHSSWALSDDHQLSFGASFSKNQNLQESARVNFDIEALTRNELPIASSTGLDFPIDFYAERQQKVMGLYTQLQSHISSKTELTLGLRYDHYSDIDDAQLSPRLAWTYKISASNNFKLLYGEAFRAPNNHELSLHNNPYRLGNPDLQSETVSTWEALYQYDNNNFYFSLGYFANKFDNPILEEAFPGDATLGRRQFTNSTHDDINGIEVEARCDLNKHLNLYAAYTAILETDPVAYRESKDLATLSLNYARKKWNLNVSVLYRGERQSASEEELITLDSYFLSYLKLQYKLKSDLQLYAQASNLADEDVFYPSPGDAIPQGVPGRGREIGIGLFWQF